MSILHLLKTDHDVASFDLHTLMRQIPKLGLILMMGGMSACSDSWKEEVLLHDGSKIIAERSQSYGGQHEIGQPSPIKEHSITFTLPSSAKQISWTSEFGEDVGRANFNLLALHVLNGIPYIVATPNLCLSYNKWSRPNPPYVLFKHDGKEWQRIQLNELPVEFKTVNLDYGMPWEIRDKEVKFDKGKLLTSETVKKHNEKIEQPEFKAIMREPLSKERVKEMCEPMVHYKCGWTGVNPDGTFNKEFMDLMCK